MNLYISKQRALNMAKLFASSRRLRVAKIESHLRKERQPNKEVDVGWTAEVLTCERIRLFA